MTSASGPTIQRILFETLTISPKTTFQFITLESSDGLHGYGEATLLQYEAQVEAAVSVLGERLLGRAVSAPGEAMDLLAFDTLPRAACSSALAQAWWDLHARHSGRSLAAAVGTHGSNRIPVYANINRATVDRTPEGFAATAREAVREGYAAFKIAPFDEITPDLGRAAVAQAMAPGLARIEAVHEVAGPDARLMVDCHWRFDVAHTDRLVDAVLPLQLYWLECPIVENDDTLADLKRIRARANAGGMRLAGCEKSILRGGFTGFLETGAYDVMMPDVKYAGGPCEMLRIADDFAGYGVEFSPHNPSGPIAHGASLQICAAVADADVLEMQFRETPLFDTLVGGGNPAITNGVAQLDADGHGIGVALDRASVDALECTARLHIGA